MSTTEDWANNILQDGTPLMWAVRCGEYRLASLLLDYGADVKLTDSNGKRRLAHYVAMQMKLSKNRSREEQAAFEFLVKRLNEVGESVAQAQKDLDDWHMDQISEGARAAKKEWEEREKAARNGGKQ